MNHFKDTSHATPIRVAQAVCVGIFIILGVALFRLQIVKGDRYRELAENNYIVQASITAPRGMIVDRSGTVIASSRQAFSICAIPRSFLRNREEIRTLGRIVGLDEEYIRSRLEATSSSYRPTAVIRDVDFATLSRVEEMFADLPDVIVISEPVRSYPCGLQFSHMLGYVGEVTQEDLAAGKGRYGRGDFIGKTGIEKVYEEYLRGRDGERFLKFSPYGGASPVDVDGLSAKAPRPGMTVVLNADAGLQKLGFDLLDGRRGAVVAVDPRTGGVLALVSSPGFDPNLFATGISTADWEEIMNADGKPLLTRPIRCAYPPGSVFKIITAAAALEGGIADKNTRYRPCAGAYRFGNRVFACWKEEGHGSRDLTDAIMVSCDVYFYQLGERLGLDRLSGYTKGWYLDAGTGIDLPGEVAGLVPDDAYYNRVYGERGWSRGVVLNLAIGQGELLLTPIEIVCFISGLANGGTYITPRCVARVESDDRAEAISGRPVELPMAASTLGTVKEGMLAVVEGPQGTGRAARVPGIRVAGKTGTAQNPHGDDHASFVCYAPFEEPEIVIFVMVENGGHGGAVAAPIAGELLAYYFGVSEPDEVTSAQ
ncbi:MAG: penicillin-binding protein 2 [Candidatus Eisenbacteria bacterium]